MMKNGKMNPKRPVPESIINLIYPPVCGICGKLNKDFLCKKCYKILETQAEFGIKKYKNNEMEFDEHLYIFKYEGIVRRNILKYKFQDKSYLYKTFANFLLKNEKFFEIIKSYDTIIPVPISRERKNKRGYNQSYLLAKEIAKKAEIGIEINCLFKTKNIIEQSKLNKEDRLQNIQGVYELKRSKNLTNKKVILLDDIYTTGSTANECCKILKKAYLNKIGVLTLAKD